MPDKELCLWTVIFNDYVAVRLLFCSLVLFSLLHWPLIFEEVPPGIEAKCY